jgi:hypothetical protein
VIEIDYTEIRVPSGRRIVLKDIAASDPMVLRTHDRFGESIALLIEAALDMPAFVEALKGRGAVVLQPGEQLPKEGESSENV